MPLPFVLLGAAAVAGGAGLISGGVGAKKIHNAKTIIETTQNNYERKKKSLEDTEGQALKSLDLLGKEKLEVWKNFKRFADAFEKIHNRPEFTGHKGEKFSFTKHELDEIQKISITAIDLLGSSVLTAGAGALAGVAAYGGTMALGVASTGTAISALSGVAATNATLAALGGGSLAAGGGGMALGSTVLCGAVAGPVLAVGGLLLNAKGNSSLQKAEEVRSEVNKALVLMSESMQHLKRLQCIGTELYMEMKNVYTLYQKQVSILEYLVSQETNFNYYTQEEQEVVDNTIMLVKLLKNLTQIDLMKKVGNKDVIQENNIKKVITESKETRSKFAA